MTSVLQRSFAIALGLALANAPAAADEKDEAAVTRARAELSRRLESAGAGGVISVRGGNEKSPQQTPAPRLRSAETADCLTLEMLTRTKSSFEPNRASSLDNLRRALLSDDGDDRTGAELALARAYLALGFAAEARAVASVRAGAEAAGIAGLALLAEGDHQRAAAAIVDFRSCGALYDLIAEVAAALKNQKHQVSDRAMETLSKLPQPLRQPIAEALATEALESSPEAAANYLALAQIPPGAPKSTAVSLIEAVTDKSDKTATTAALAAIGGTPGPLRAPALKALNQRLEKRAPPMVTAALEADIEEAVDLAPLSQSISTLNLTLAERRAERRDFRGAARALGNAYRDDRTREAAAAKFGAMVRPILLSNNVDDKLLALDAIVVEPELAAAGIPAQDTRLAADLMAELGAFEALAQFLSVSRLDSKDKAFAAGRALIRAGQVANGRALMAPYDDDPRVLETIFKTATDVGDAAVANGAAAANQLDLSIVTGALWRVGDFATLTSLPKSSRADAAAATRIALAFLTEGKRPPENVIASTANAEGAAALFAPIPNPGRSPAREMQRFAQQQKLEVAFLRQAVSDE